jgi:hypothetical protein
MDGGDLRNRSFQRLAGTLAIAVAVGGLAYGILFGWIVLGAPEGIFVTWLVLAVLGGLAVTAVFVGAYEAFRDIAKPFLLWALLLGVAAGLGQMLHASVALGYEVGAAAPPPRGFEGTPDPVGILRFGVNGLALFLLGWVIARSQGLPRTLGLLAQLGGVLLVLMYVGRLTGVIDPANRVTLIPPLLYGLLVHPVFFVWLGLSLRRGAPAEGPGPGR